jgi:GNAT superfamily N-acetyltransferase
MEVDNEIRPWLEEHFGLPPQKPRLVMEKGILCPQDIGLLVRDKKTSSMIGFLRYHWMGTLLSVNKEIYSVDCFCIHPQWRGKGVGDYLLTELQRYANEVGKPYAMFLKEGPSLPIFHRPIYSGEYAYRYTLGLQEPLSPNVYKLTLSQVKKAIHMYRGMYPSTWIVWNQEGTGQTWLLYQRNSCYVWACIQSAHQVTEKGLRMGWMTAWLETGELTPSFRAEACLALTQRVWHGYDAIWVDRKWTGGSVEWRADGWFHFYTYQWSTNQSIGMSYCNTQ